jgi:CRP-like cAMP-binding protein
MTAQLTLFLQKNTRLAAGEISDIISAFKPVKIKRNEHLVEIGTICRNLYFINKGSLRIYGFDKKGNEITSYFAFENSSVTTLTSFIDQKPSRDGLIAIEKSEVLKIDRAAFFSLTENHPAFKEFYNSIVQFAFIHSQMRVYSFLGMEGIDKLKWVIEHEPELLNRISSKAVASYLGVTNSTLSKLKAKL